MFQSSACLGRPGAHPFWVSLAGLFWLLGAAAVLIGFATAVASALIAFAGIGSLLSWMLRPAPDLFEARGAGVLLIVMAFTLALVGPGALSLDARLFGLREIVIPRVQRYPHD
jgi:uncharacterized membrane protein YphA (DoxX/SURF4 family)